MWASPLNKPPKTQHAGPGSADFRKSGIQNPKFPKIWDPKSEISENLRSKIQNLKFPMRDHAAERSRMGTPAEDSDFFEIPRSKTRNSRKSAIQNLTFSRFLAEEKSALGASNMEEGHQSQQLSHSLDLANAGTQTISKTRESLNPGFIYYALKKTK